MKLPKIFCLLMMSVALAAIGPIACSNTTLESGSQYSLEGQKPDKSFYAVDAAFELAYSAANTVFDFEKNNRQMLWDLSPDIKHSLDKVRPTAKDVVIAYAKARKEYIANPTPTGLSRLETVLGRMQQIASAARTALPQPKTNSELPVKK